MVCVRLFVCIPIGSMHVDDTSLRRVYRFVPDIAFWADFANDNRPRVSSLFAVEDMEEVREALCKLTSKPGFRDETTGSCEAFHSVSSAYVKYIKVYLPKCKLFLGEEYRRGRDKNLSSPKF